MNRPQTSQPWWDALSVSVFCLLLALYPARYRRAYGEPMRQVFRASLRDAARRGGAAGIVRLWLRTLGDLLLTALAERLELAMTQTPSALYRATGLVSLVGIVAWIIGPILLGAGLALSGSMQSSSASMMMMLLPVGWLFFVIGFIGLYAWLARQCGWLVWIPGALAIATLLVMIVAALYWSYNSQIGVSYEGSTTVVNLAQASAVDQALDYEAYQASYLAYPALGLTLLATGLLALRSATSRAAARTLLVMGALAVVYYFFTDMGAPPLLRNTGTPGVLGMAAGALAFFGAWLIGWLRLGRWLWQAGALTPTTATTSPSISPSLD